MAWRGFVKNRGQWEGRRGLYDARGTELLDLRSEAVVEAVNSGADDEVESCRRVRWRTEAYRGSGEVEVEDVEWTRYDLEQFGSASEDGSFSIGPRAVSGESFKVEQCALGGDFRVRSSHAYDWEGRLSGLVIARERRKNLVQPGINPSAWKSSSALFEYFLGTWQGSGSLLQRVSGRTIEVCSNLTLTYNLNGELCQTSSLSVVGGPFKKVQATAQRDNAILSFSRAGVQMLLLPGGVSIAGPMVINRGEPFVVELAFLPRPDERVRVARCYDGEGAWMNTVFLTERRVASLRP